jgi:DNA-directed RNA polymerase specialized sigma24 family protein
MTDARNFRLLDVDRLADECADHTARFFNRATYDPGYCYELFRRAIVDRNNYAWDKIYRQYQPLVVKWVINHTGLPATGEEVDYFVNGAFDRMWSAVDAEKFKQFDDLAEVLRYFKLCAHSVIVDYTRVNPIDALDLEPFPPLLRQDLPSIEERITGQLERQELWEAVAALMHNEKDTIVLEWSFMYDLKPSAIYAENSARFESLDEVYRVKRNLLNRLRRNPDLQQFLSNSFNEF